MDPVYRLWFDREENAGPITCVMTATQIDGQERIVGSRTFGPFDSYDDVVAWVWKRLADEAGLR